MLRRRTVFNVFPVYNIRHSPGRVRHDTFVISSSFQKGFNEHDLDVHGRY